MIRNDNSLNVSLLNIESFFNKAEIRKYLLQAWAIETIHTKYRYFVETLNNGNRIYLERPGRLNKGCDFVIYLENIYVYNNGNDKPPSHKYIFNDLIQKKQNLTRLEWNGLLEAIDIIFNCGKYDDTIVKTRNLPIIGLDYDSLLKLLRWFFIEQDLTYWSGMGRKMLFRDINNV